MYNERPAGRPRRPPQRAELGGFHAHNEQPGWGHRGWVANIPNDQRHVRQRRALDREVAAEMRHGADELDPDVDERVA